MKDDTGMKIVGGIQVFCKFVVAVLIVLSVFLLIAGCTPKVKIKDPIFATGATGQTLFDANGNAIKIGERTFDGPAYVYAADQIVSGPEQPDEQKELTEKILSKLESIDPTKLDPSAQDDYFDALGDTSQSLTYQSFAKALDQKPQSKEEAAARMVGESEVAHAQKTASIVHDGVSLATWGLGAYVMGKAIDGAGDSYQANDNNYSTGAASPGGSPGGAGGAGGGEGAGGIGGEGGSAIGESGHINVVMGQNNTAIGGLKSTAPFDLNMRGFQNPTTTNAPIGTNLGRRDGTFGVSF